MLYKALLELVISILIGSIIFYKESWRQVLLKKLLRLMVCFTMPLYLMIRISKGWVLVSSVDYLWIVIFFLAAALQIIGQFISAKQLSKKLRPETYKREVQLLFSFQNAGNLILPMLSSLKMPRLVFFAMFYTLFFQLLFWFMLSFIYQKKNFFRIPPPVIGVLIGVVLGILNLQLPDLPITINALDFNSTILNIYSWLSLKFILVLLGGILRGISLKGLSFNRITVQLLVGKMTIYPLILLLMFKLLNRYCQGLELLWFNKYQFELLGLEFLLVLQAAMPPATNLLVVASLFEQEAHKLRFMGHTIFLAYAYAALSISLVGALWFRYF